MKKYVYFLAGLLLAAMIVLILASPVGARSQDIPTPTFPPVQNTPYTLTVVGGSSDHQVFPGVEQNGFTLGETTVESLYPQGMKFSVQVESQNGDIDAVTLYIVNLTGSQERVTAAFDDTASAWIARVWETSTANPPWRHFDFFWSVRDSSGATIETSPLPTDYWDPTRQWNRMESDFGVVYWFGLPEDRTNEIAQGLADALASTHIRLVDGFGAPLIYKPTFTVFPNRQTANETYFGTASEELINGFANSQLGYALVITPDGTIPPGQENCIWFIPPAEWTMEDTLRTVYGNVTFLNAFFYDQETLGGFPGPNWWFMGTSGWFSSDPNEYDRHLRYLATLQDIPSLTEDIGSQQIRADGCPFLGVEVGESFINWLVTNFGGIEAYHQVIMMMGEEQRTVYEAVEAVIGKPFADIENEWRVYLGFPPLDLAATDPEAALQAPVDPVAADGDTVTLPAAPMMVPLYEAPGPAQPTSGQCFGGTPVEILKVGSLDGIDYYKVDCMGMIGWLTRDQIAGAP